MVLRPQAKTSLMPKRLYMDNSSFRDILARFLEENPANSPLENTSDETKRLQPDPIPFFMWESPNLKQIPRDFSSTGYPQQPPRKIVPPPEAKPARAPVERPKPVEKFFELKQLQPLDQDAVQSLLTLGAIELNGVLSTARLKKAHRRLAKALHPDRIATHLSVKGKIQRREQFLMLQAAYETLSRALKALNDASETTSDSESASAAESRRQDAA
jgi:hypothetical protein